MGSALIRGMIASGLTTGKEITIASKTDASAHKAALSLGTRAAATPAEALSDAQVIFLCVKPSQSLEVLTQISPQLQGKLVISIVAGIHADDLLKAAGTGVRVIRTMPNTAVRLRKGITAVARDKTHQDARLDLEARAKKLLDRAA